MKKFETFMDSLADDVTPELEHRVYARINIGHKKNHLFKRKFAYSVAFAGAAVILFVLGISVNKAQNRPYYADKHLAMRQEHRWYDCVNNKFYNEQHLYRDAFKENDYEN